MKVFISHKLEDRNTALLVQQTLEKESIDTYLDVLDSTITNDGEQLTEHIRSNLNTCSDVIVILSSATKNSWWVPFEIGMAAEKDLFIANYLLSYEKLPEYLEYWPRLKSQMDVSEYVRTRLEISRQMISESINKGYGNYTANFDGRTSETQRFYTELKKRLAS